MGIAALPGTQRLWRGADHTTPSRAKTANRWSYYLYLTTVPEYHDMGLTFIVASNISTSATYILVPKM
jgi:hypothetical protein